MYHNKDLSKIDLSNLSVSINNPEAKKYFLLHPGQEHYILLAYISTLYNNVLLYDIGTYRGCSALALSYNNNNKVKSLDIVDHKQIINSPDNIEWIVGNFMDQSIEEIHSSPLIMLDIDHTGKTEKEILDFLVDNNWHGHLLLDDIYLNDDMRQFWNSIKQQKYDLTTIGHFSGTGLVVL